MRAKYTKKEIVEKRRELDKISVRKFTFNKGDRRVFTPKVCVVCGRPLTSLIIQDNKYITTTKHTRFHLNKVFIVDTCTDVNSCYRRLKSEGVMDNG